jgi:hypothetical protein
MVDRYIEVALDRRCASCKLVETEVALWWGNSQGNWRGTSADADAFSAELAVVIALRINSLPRWRRAINILIYCTGCLHRNCKTRFL